MASFSSNSSSPLFHIFLLLSSISIACSSFDLSSEKETHLRFYFHEITAGPNQTCFIVAGPDITSSNTFGDIVVYDNALREGPEPNSKLVGRAQGMGIWSSMEDRSVLTPSSLVFTEASEYSGSSLEIILGRVPAAGTAERTVVGGSGEFRLARGYAISSVVNESTGLFVMH